MFSVEKAKEFYLDYLGFHLDWEHKFEEVSPIYMQVSAVSAVCFRSAKPPAFRNSADCLSWSGLGLTNNVR